LSTLPIGHSSAKTSNFDLRRVNGHNFAALSSKKNHLQSINHLTIHSLYLVRKEGDAFSMSENSSRDPEKPTQEENPWNKEAKVAFDT
jgi:hypothetical protein